MLKYMLLLKRKAGLSLQECIDHYENVHVPLATAYHAGVKRHIRHFLRPSPYPLDGSVVEAEYDILTELWFDDRQAFDAYRARVQQPEVRQITQADIARFLDPAKMRRALIEEHESDLPGKQPDPARDVRCFVLLKRKPGMTLEQFIEYYETRHARLGEKYGSPMSRYRRMFLRPVPALDGSIDEAAYDVVTEVSFPDKAAMVLANQQVSAPEAAAIVEADEERFLNRATRRFVFVESRETVPDA